VTIVNGDGDDDYDHDDDGGSHDASTVTHNVELFCRIDSYATIKVVGKIYSYMMRHHGEPQTKDPTQGGGKETTHMQVIINIHLIKWSNATAQASGPLGLGLAKGPRGELSL